MVLGDWIPPTPDHGHSFCELFQHTAEHVGSRPAKTGELAFENHPISGYCVSAAQA